MKKFWNFIKNEDTGETELYFEGPISDSTWYGDEITPKIFKDELSKHPGNLTVWLCSSQQVRSTPCSAIIRAKLR